MLSDVTMTTDVDILVLSRNAGPLQPEVEQGIAQQEGVRLNVYRATGTPLPGDRCRWDAIVRGRNEAKHLGSSAWVMFLDDDVVLGAGCVRRLVDEMQQRPVYGALAADYLGEQRSGMPRPHVSLGATLFRRDALQRIRFRWQDGKCECQCCCDDLRRMLMGIDYCVTAQARHLARSDAQRHERAAPGDCPESLRVDVAPRVLTAFNRLHFEAFANRFLRSMRRAGNEEPVTAVAFDLTAAERRKLESLPNVEVLQCRTYRRSVPLMRVREFQSAIARLDPQTPVAYWDAGDVIIQGRLEPLWELVHQYPDKLLAVRETRLHPMSPTETSWTLRIPHPRTRYGAFRLLTRRPVLNGGFAAGNASALMRYLKYADRLLSSAAFAGTAGDQTALNLYCYGNPRNWREVSQGWNYCLFGRQPGEVLVRKDGRVISSRATPIHVVHGNAGSLRTVLAPGQSLRTGVPSPISSSFAWIR